jgi:hypothetical protein
MDNEFLLPAEGLLTLNTSVEFLTCVNSFFFFFVVLGLELRAFTLRHSTSPIFVKDFIEIESHELFAWAGIEL